MTVEEAGRRGGLRTSATHGEKFYSEIGRKGVRIGRKKRSMKRDNYTLYV
jgi:general stress protein YciG